MNFHDLNERVVIGKTFRLESFARIIVSGLFVDPDVKWTSVRISLKDLLSQKRPLNHDAIDRRGGMTKSSPSARVSDRPSASHAASLSTTSIWRVATAEESRPHLTRGTSTLEAPFQSAIEKQRSLSEQGRPYLRHSWHRIDFVSVVSFWITFALSIAGVESTAHAHIYIFRALSVMRISRLLAVTSGTAVRELSTLSLIGFHYLFLLDDYAIVEEGSSVTCSGCHLYSVCHGLVLVSQRPYVAKGKGS